MRTVRSALPFASALVVLAACNSDRDQPGISTALGLTSFDSCAELEQYIEDTAVQQMKNQLDPENFGGGGIPVLAATEATRSAAGDAGGANGGAPTAYTRTNTQVRGVDEADFVKTNGTHIYALSGRDLYIAKSWPASDLALTSKIRIEGYPREMFLEEDTGRVSVLSLVATGGTNGSGGSSGGAPRQEFAWYCAEWGCGVQFVTTKLTVIDTSTATAPRIADELYLPGRYQNARRIGTSLRLILEDDFRWPENIRWWPEDPDDDGEIYDLQDTNERLIRARTLAEWLPAGRRRTSGGSMIDVGYECTDFAHPNASMELALMTVATIDLANPETAPGRTSIVARTHEVYASQESLYLAGWHWWWWPRAGQRDWTYLFKLDIRDPAKATLIAAGGVEGHIVDQFSMDEHEGHLRVATTIARRVEDDDNIWGRIETTNRVSVIGVRGDGLRVVGQTPDMAEGERVFSSRFIGDKGFVVTFRQVDPLFTLDLSNPENPHIVGELKVPGFSTYIHPLDANYLLTIGIHQEEPDPSGRVDWQRRAMKLSIFDVSDFAHPREVHTRLVGSAYGWSEALHEHKAFNFFPERGLLAIPFSDWLPYPTAGSDYWGNFVSELRVFHVDATSGFSSKGAISMNDMYPRTTDDYEWSFWWSPWVRRSVMADDFVYAISDAGIRSAQVDALNRPLASITFDRAEAQ